MVEIIPSILTDNTGEALDLINRCEEKVHRVQIDIVDGVFAENKTIDPSNLNSLETSLGLDFHLMVKDPVKWVEKCVRVGADRIIGQIEMMESQEEFVNEVQSKNLRVGLAIDLDTAVGEIDQNMYGSLDVVLVMTVKAGFGGQKFQMNALEKVKELNDIRIKNRTPFRICVDGGETEEVIDDSVMDGADEVVVGRRLFKGDLTDNINNMQTAAEN